MIREDGKRERERERERTTCYWHNLMIFGLLVECSPMAWETGIQSQVKSYQTLKQWFLIPPCLTLSIIRYISRVKWSNTGKGVAPSPMSRCSSY